MEYRQQHKRPGWLPIVGFGIVVLAFMVLSLAVTATGTARFALAMGYTQIVGYVVGGVFDVAKAILPVVLLALLARRAFGAFVILGIAWAGLVTYSGLATHSTVSLAIHAIERAGTWQIETRTGAKTELASVEHRVSALSRPTPPRPQAGVRPESAARASFAS